MPFARDMQLTPNKAEEPEEPMQSSPVGLSMRCLCDVVKRLFRRCPESVLPQTHHRYAQELTLSAVACPTWRNDAMSHRGSVVERSLLMQPCKDNEPEH